MLTPSLLRGLGPDGLAVLLRRRPDLLSPVPPKSLAELIARLTHPVGLATALEGLSQPALDVAQALAALGPAADRARLDTLLGIPPDDPRAGAVTQALTELRDRLLLAEKCRLLPQLREHWRAPLGLGDDVATLATGSTVEDLLAVLRSVAPPVTATRKADLIARLVTALGDGERVRELVRSAPPGLAEKLVDVAFGRRQPDYYRWFSPRHHRSADSASDPWTWALARFLVVRVHWTPTLQMPSEVALALRGPGWAAPFTVTPPEVSWTRQAPKAVTGACVAAAGQALRSLTAVLSAAGQQPIPLLKSGQVGVRELRRLAALAGCETGPLRLTLALAYWLDLLDLTDNGLAPTLAFDGWQRRPAAERAADLVRIWSTLPMSPLVEPAAAWAPQSDRQVVPLRRAVLDLLAEHPQAAPDTPRSLIRLLHWRAPLLVTSSGSDDGPDGDPESDPDDGPEVLAVLAEAAWLGVTGAGALSAIGQAAQAGDDVAAALGDALGVVQVRARLQADLTAVVLGEPSPDLAAALDAMADRESRSAATIWRFSPGSVRRFLDAGVSEAEVLDRLRDLADGPVPQPLDYLVRDVARRHGTLRGGGVSCYLRSSDKALLAELVVDRKLAKLHLRRVAPTIVVGARSLPETLAALRAAGYAPVEEGSDGEIVPVRVPRYRAEAQTPDLSPEADGTVPEIAVGATRRVDHAAGVDPVAAATALLAGPDRARGRLVDLGTCVVDIGSLEELGDQLFV
jgi:hypothetical protein